MNACILLVVAAIILIIGYIFYGGYLAKQWGIDNKNITPAHSMEDGVDYVPAKPYVVIGHHFSSIAGAGPINGPIQAAIFGWVPVVLWILIGGIFFGAMHDFGALFASLRHKGQTLAAVVEKNIDPMAKKLFCVFAFLTLVLVVAAFASIVAGTFDGFTIVKDPVTGLPTGEVLDNIANRRTAMISILFIIAAILWGLLTRGRNLPGAVMVIGAIVVIVVIVAIGYNWHPIALTTKTWMWIIGVYILVASVAPVWILLQPRDYLSSYLLYGMIILAIIGIIGATIFGSTHFDMPAFTAFNTTTLYPEATAFSGRGFLLPSLFVTIACGAISGFHSLVASGTTSKQLDKESHAKPIAYGGMLLECLLAVVSLCAVAYIWKGVSTGTFAGGPTQIFAGGLSAMIGVIPGLGNIGGEAGSIAYSLLILAVSAFCLTSLDTATRIGRMMFQEMFTKAGETAEEQTGWRKVITNPYVATIITVVLGVALGMTGYQYIWPLFGAANQLLAALALLAICSFLGNIGRNNKMFYIPMVFMLCVTLISLVLTAKAKILALSTGAAFAVGAATPAWAVILQLILAIVLFILAIVLAVKACKSIFGKKAEA